MQLIQLAKCILGFSLLRNFDKILNEGKVKITRRTTQSKKNTILQVIESLGGPIFFCIRIFLVRCLV